MIHAQQKGYQPPEVLKGLCDAVVRNYKGTITKGKVIEPPVAFIGGVAANKGAVQALREAFGLADGSLFVPEYYAWMGAIGAALIEADARPRARPRRPTSTSTRLPASEFPTTSPCHGQGAPAARHGQALPVRRTTRSSTPTWASTSARSPPTWWSSTTPAR